jgi:hypothetical protein
MIMLHCSDIIDTKEHMEEQKTVKNRLNLTLPIDLILYVKDLARKNYCSSASMITQMILFWIDNHKV